MAIYTKLPAVSHTYSVPTKYLYNVYIKLRMYSILVAGTLCLWYCRSVLGGRVSFLLGRVSIICQRLIIHFVMVGLSSHIGYPSFWIECPSSILILLSSMMSSWCHYTWVLVLWISTSLQV